MGKWYFFGKVSKRQLVFFFVLLQILSRLKGVTNRVLGYIAISQECTPLTEPVPKTRKLRPLPLEMRAKDDSGGGGIRLDDAAAANRKRSWILWVVVRCPRLFHCESEKYCKPSDELMQSGQKKEKPRQKSQVYLAWSHYGDLMRPKVKISSMEDQLWYRSSINQSDSITLLVVIEEITS